MKKLLYFMYCFLHFTIIATPQVSDIISINGKKSELLIENFWGSPLVDYYNKNELPSPFIEYSTANYRDHIASWKIENQQLYLTEISDKELLEMFPDQYRNGKVHATWFSGEILVYHNNQYHIFGVFKGKVFLIFKLNEEEYHSFVLHFLENNIDYEPFPDSYDPNGPPGSNQS